MAVNTRNEVFVADSINHFVHVFKLDGVYVSKFGSRCRGRAYSIRCLTTDFYGFALATDFSEHRGLVFDKNKNCVHCFGVTGSGVGELKNPCGIAISPCGSIYVADCGNSRLQVFSDF